MLRRPLATFKAAGFLLVMVTNQPDVARGVTRRQDVETMHATLCAALPLDAVYVCYHDDADACGCRKPLPGMLLQAAAAHGIDRAASFMAGDRWRDVDAGVAAGCRTVWIDRGYRERGPSAPPGCAGAVPGGSLPVDPVDPCLDGRPDHMRFMTR